MQTFINNLQFHIFSAEQTSLDKRWDSDFFLPAYRCIRFSRLYMPCSGEGFMVCDEQTFTLKKGSLFLISPFARIHLSCPNHLVKYWCHFNAYTAGSGNDIFSMLPGVTEFKISDEQYLYYEKLFQQIIATRRGGFAKDPSASLETLYANSALMLLAAPFLNLMLQSHVPHKDVDRIFSVMQYMNENLSSEVTLKDLADVVGLHPNYLSTIFLQCMGMSPISFLSTLRMNYAVTELQRGVLRIGEIGEKIGFSKKSSFSKFFRQHIGVSPRMWREKYNQDPQRFKF